MIHPFNPQDPRQNPNLGKRPAKVAERVIATMHQLQEDGEWRMVAEQDVTHFDEQQMHRFTEIQNAIDRMIIHTRKEVPK